MSRISRTGFVNYVRAARRGAIGAGSSLLALACIAAGAQTAGSSPSAPTKPEGADGSKDQSVAVAPLGAPVPDASVVPVAPPEPAQPSTQAPATLGATEAFSEFRHLFDASQYPAAVPYAQRLLDLAEQDAKSPDAEEVQVALMNLATTQHLAEDYTAAETSYRRVIALAEGSGRALHARLTRAYAGLASTYHDSERHDLAVKNFEQAVGLTRRHEGVLSDQQVPLIEKYVDSLTELGRYDEALRGQRYILRIAVRKYGENSADLAPTLESIGRWYAQVGGYDQSRRLLKRAIELVEIGDGPDSLKLLSPLSALAACNRKQLLDPTQQMLGKADAERSAMFQEPGVAPPAYSTGILTAEAEKALLRAAAIAEAGTNPSPLLIADVRTQLGDWYQGRGLADRAAPNYEMAWSAASRAKEQKLQGKSLTEALFGQPVLLQVVRPDGWRRYAERPPDQVEVRSVQIEFTVNTQGGVEAARVLDDTGDPKRAEKTVAALKGSARYRPRMENGEAVATSGVTFTQPWVVLLAPEGEAGTPADTSPGRRTSKPDATKSSPPAPTQALTQGSTR